jgi:hypothetical protein
LEAFLQYLAGIESSAPHSHATHRTWWTSIATDIRREGLLDEARLALALAERATEHAKQATRPNTGRLTLGFLLESEIDLMMQVMSTLHGELDGVMRSESSPDLIEALNRRELGRRLCASRCGLPEAAVAAVAQRINGCIAAEPPSSGCGERAHRIGKETLSPF